MKEKKWILYSLAAALLACAVIWAGALKRVDRWVQDALFQHPAATNTDIVLIGIDETALDVFGPYHTWDRNIMASALEKLAEDPDSLPAAVAVDILYAGASSAQADSRLAEAARRLGCVVTATAAEYGEEITWENGRAIARNTSAVVDYLEPYPELKEATVQGHINIMYDMDGILRHSMLYEDIPGQGRVYSMAYRTAELYCARRGLPMPKPRSNDSGFFYIPYYARSGGYDDGLSLAALIAGKIPPGFWKDKIVLIGPYAASLQDAYFTAIDRAEQMNGVEIQANIIQGMLEGRSLQEVGDLPQLIALFLLCAGAMMLFLRLRVLHGASACAGLIVFGAVLSFVMYRLGYVTHPLWLPACALVLYVAALAVHYLHAARARHALELEKQRITTELSLATRIQESALLRTFPAFPERSEFDLHASMTPAKEVGGDLYDFFMPDDDHLVLLIGDVSGKGIPAALFMMVAVALLRHVAMREPSPAAVLKAVNEEICARNPAEMFVTVWLGVLEISTGRLTCANAGHEYPAFREAGGSFELYKDRHGFVLGGMDGVRYREYEIQMTPGSRIFVYTDGVAEATNAENELFGTDRMIEALRSAQDGSPREILSAVDTAVSAFVGSAPQFDDLTMLCLQYNGKKE